MNPILENYIPMAKLISQTFGSHCEVIIHDFSKPQNSVVYTENNTVTNREIGESFTEYFVKEVLLSRKFNHDCCANYIMNGKDGKKIKSSTALIRDLNGKVIGALCVNIDLGCLTDFMDGLGKLLGIPDPSVQTTEEMEPITTIREIVDDIIDKTIGEQDVSSMSREQKISIIRFLNDKEIFAIKGALEKVAERMNISKVTVYSYLDEIKKQNG
ncbi:MAG: helix-turn-helix transcriptional regulator [Lachnospiraceae bacterium]|jgi:predicted transcriptional regulator YheO